MYRTACWQIRKNVLVRHDLCLTAQQPQLLQSNDGTDSVFEMGKYVQIAVGVFPSCVWSPGGGCTGRHKESTDFWDPEKGGNGEPSANAQRTAWTPEEHQWAGKTQWDTPKLAILAINDLPSPIFKFSTFLPFWVSVSQANTGTLSHLCFVGDLWDPKPIWKPSSGGRVRRTERLWE